MYELIGVLALILVLGAYVGYRAYKRKAKAHRIAEVFWDSDITEKWNKEFGRDRDKK